MKHKRIKADRCASELLHCFASYTHTHRMTSSMSLERYSDFPTWASNYLEPSDSEQPQGAMYLADQPHATANSYHPIASSSGGSNEQTPPMLSNASNYVVYGSEQSTPTPDDRAVNSSTAQYVDYSASTQPQSTWAASTSTPSTTTGFGSSHLAALFHQAATENSATALGGKHISNRTHDMTRVHMHR
jgi:hypothetical protein